MTNNDMTHELHVLSNPLYYMLVMMLNELPLEIVRNPTEGDRAKASRMLLREYEPRHIWSEGADVAETTIW